MQKSQLPLRPNISKISTYPETRKTPKSQLTRRPEISKISTYPETQYLRNLNFPGDPKTPKSSPFNIPPLINTASTMSTTYLYTYTYIHCNGFPHFVTQQTLFLNQALWPPPTSAKFNLTFLPLLFSAMGKNKWVSLTWCLL